MRDSNAYTIEEVKEDIIVPGEEVYILTAKLVPLQIEKDDFSLHGWRTRSKSDPEGTEDLVQSIIKNTYRTLMTRGMKGCYLYVVDEELRNHIKSRII